MNASMILDMGSPALTFDLANLKNVVLPVSHGGGGDLVKNAAAPALLADFGDDAVRATR